MDVTIVLADAQEAVRDAVVVITLVAIAKECARGLVPRNVANALPDVRRDVTDAQDADIRVQDAEARAVDNVRQRARVHARRLARRPASTLVKVNVMVRARQRVRQ